MKHYLKRNIHHPIIAIAGVPVPWQRVSNSGVIATDDAETIKVLDEAVLASKGAVQALTEDQFKQAVGEKKTQLSTTRRTFSTRKVEVDASRSKGRPAKSVTPSSDSPAPAAAPAVAAPRRGRPPRVVASAPAIAAPPGVATVGVSTEDAPEPS